MWRCGTIPPLDTQSDGSSKSLPQSRGSRRKAYLLSAALDFAHLFAQTSDPDRVSGSRSSIAHGSEMDEFAFTPALRQLILSSPGIPILHVPSQLCAMWKHYPHLADVEVTTASSATASCAAAAAAAPSPLTTDAATMGAWLQAHRAPVMASRYLAFHWSSGHFCSLVVDLQVWRAGPSGQPSPASRVKETTVLIETAAAAVSVVDSPPTKRARRASRSQREAQQDERSTCETSVPLLHMDTLPDACAFLDDRADFLRSLCVELNHFFGTSWPVRLLRDLRTQVHLCGPSMQTDGWSCGYRLLDAWASVFAAMRESPALSPARVNDICNRAEQQHDLPTMIDQARELYDSVGAGGWVSLSLTEHGSLCRLHVLIAHFDWRLYWELVDYGK